MLRLARRRLRQRDRLDRRLGRDVSACGLGGRDLLRLAGVAARALSIGSLWTVSSLCRSAARRWRATLVAAAAVAGAAVGLGLGVAMGALFLLDQRLPVGDRDLVVVGMDFAEGEEAVAIAAVVDEGGLERGLHAGDLGEIDVAAKLLAVSRLEVEFLDPISTHHDHPGLLRMGRVDEHFVGHRPDSWRCVARSFAAVAGSRGRGTHRIVG